MTTKDVLRKKVRNDLGKMSRRSRATASRGIIRRLRRLPEYASAGAIFCFVSKDGEPDTVGFLKAEIAAGRRKVFVPRVSTSGIEAVRLRNFGELKEGRFGILEPVRKRASSILPSGTLIIAPGMAFDLRGARLGRGKGCYDRFLAGVGRRKMIGLVFDEFLYSVIPASRHDVNVGIVVTDKRVVVTVDRNRKAAGQGSGKDKTLMSPYSPPTKP